MIRVHQLRLAMPAIGIAAIVWLAAGGAHPTAAPAFKVDKYDIKGEGGTDYVTVESATGRVFVSRSTHMMVVETNTRPVADSKIGRAHV